MTICDINYSEPYEENTKFLTIKRLILGRFELLVKKQKFLGNN